MSERENELSSVVAALTAQMKNSRGRPRVDPLQSTDAIRALLVVATMLENPELQTRRQAIGFLQSLSHLARERSKHSEGQVYRHFGKRFPTQDLEQSVSRGMRTLRKYLLKNGG